MFFRLYIFLAAVFVVLFLYLSSLNHQTLSLRVTGAASTEVPAVPLIFITFISGFLLHYLISLIKRGKDLLDRLKTSKERKNLESARALYKDGKKAMLLGDVIQGEDLLQRCISKESSLAEPYSLLVNYYLNNKEYDRAETVLKKAPPELRTDLDLLMAKGRLLMARSDFDGAAETLSEINKTESSIATRRLLRDALIRAAKWQEAAEVQKEIKKALSREEFEFEENLSVQIAHELAKKMIEEGKVDDAVRKLTDLSRKNKGHAPPYVVLGKLYWKEGERDLAVETWKKGFNATSNLIFIFLLEDFYLTEEDPEGIIDVYSQLIVENSDNALLQLLFGKLYLRLEMIEDVMERLKKAEELGLSSTYLSQMQGEALFRVGQFRESSEKFKEALNLKRRIRIPFVCGSCGFNSFEWSGSCPECGGWNSLDVPIETPEMESG